MRGAERTLYASVATGSLIGAMLRAAVSMIAIELAGPGFPFATLAVNVMGSFLIGFYAALTGPDGRLLVSPARRHFVMTGFCGGFTTFSAFSLETFTLFRDGKPVLAGVNIAASLVLWLVAVWLGHAAATRFNRLKGGSPHANA